MTPELAEARDRAQAAVNAAIEQIERDARELARLHELLNARTFAANKLADLLHEAGAEIEQLRGELAAARADLADLAAARARADDQADGEAVTE